MAKKLFVSNLDFDINSAALRALFAEIGEVSSATIATAKDGARSKGFGFVEMATDELAAQAIQALNGKPLRGRPLKVVEDRGKPAPSFEGRENASGDGEGGKVKFEPLPAVQRTQLFRRKKRLDPFMEDATKTIDYRDTALLTRYLSERGQILSRRNTGLSSFNQRKVSKAIKRAQQLGLIPFSAVQG